MEQINFNLVTGDPQYTPGDLGIQISDARGRPVGMIGSDQSGATCDIQGGGNYYAQMALAPGRDGTVFALSQADLTTTDSGKLGDDSTFTPSVPFGQGGDQVIEFAPGAGQACPPPSPMVLVNGQDADTTTVNVNDEVDLDISTSDLQGEAPTEIDGDLDGSGRYATVDAMSGDNGWSWPSAIQSTSFDTAGRYTIGARAHTVDGVFQTTRTIVVNDPGAPVARIAANGSGFKAGDTVTFTADGSSGGGDNSVADYNWDFNDGSDPDDTDAPTDTHTFTQPGDYTATLRVISSASPPRTATATVSVHVDPADTNTGGGGDQNNGGGGDQNNQGGGQTTTQVTPPPATTSTTPPPPARLSNTPPAPKVATPSAKVSSGKIAVGFKPSAAGTVTIRLTAKVGKRTVVIGTAHATVKAGKVVSLKVTPTKAGRRALAKKTKVTMTITLKPKSGKSVTVTKTASLKFAVAAKPKAEHKK